MPESILDVGSPDAAKTFAQLHLDNGFRKLDKPEPIRIEWNRDASSLLCAITLGCFIMTAAVLLHLFTDLWQ